MGLLNEKKILRKLDRDIARKRKQIEIRHRARVRNIKRFIAQFKKTGFSDGVTDSLIGSSFTTKEGERVRIVTTSFFDGDAFPSSIEAMPLRPRPGYSGQRTEIKF